MWLLPAPFACHHRTKAIELALSEAFASVDFNLLYSFNAAQSADESCGE